MSSAATSFASDPYGVSRRRRIVSAVLACALPALIVFMLLRLGVFVAPPVAPRSPAVFDLSPDAPREPVPTPRKAPPAGGGAPAAARAVPRDPRITPPPPPRPTTTPVPSAPLDIIPLSREDFAAADIGRMPVGPPAPVGGSGGSGGSGNAGSGTGSGTGAGTGPGGETLYNAEWVREPTRAELAFYLRGAMPDGAWAEIACRTLPGFRVDQCQELGQHPSGLGLAGAMRQAAWQFRVRPPRVGGKTLVGAWVRIHISFSGPPA